MTDGDGLEAEVADCRPGVDQTIADERTPRHRRHSALADVQPFAAIGHEFAVFDVQIPLCDTDGALLVEPKPPIPKGIPKPIPGAGLELDEDEELDEELALIADDELEADEDASVLNSPPLVITPRRYGLGDRRGRATCR